MSDFSASLIEHTETDLFRAGLIHALPTELASVGSARLRGQGVDKSGVVTLTKSGQACPLDFGYGDQALDLVLMLMYGDTIPTRNLHFIMGTMAAHPRTFIVIGLLRSGLDLAEVAKPSDLLK